MFVYDVICSGYDKILHKNKEEGKEEEDKEEGKEKINSSASGEINLISNNIEILRNNIKTFIDDNRTEYVYSNPVRFLISDEFDDNSDARSDWENDENNELISLEKLRNDADIKMKKINNALDSIVEKEVIEFGEKEFGEKMAIEEFNWNVNNIKKFTIFKVNGIFNDNQININSNKFGIFIDKISQLFDKCTIIKPVLSDPYSDEIYMLFGNKKNDICVENAIPMNYEYYIDFLYAMYSYAMYVLNLVHDIKYKTNLLKIEFINLSTQNEYKFIVEKCKRKMELLGIK